MTYICTKTLYLTKYHISKKQNPIQMAAILNYKMAVTLKLYIYIYKIYLDSGILHLLEL